MEEKSIPQYVQTFLSGDLPNPREHEHVSNRISPKCSPGHAECSFDNPAESSSLTVPKMFAQSPEIIRSVRNFLKNFVLKCSSGDI